VETLRTVAGDVGGRPVVIEGIGFAGGAPATLVDARWEDIAGAFYAGEGVLASDTFARMHSLRVGDSVALRTPDGPRSFRIVGLQRDIFGGDVGSVAVDAAVYRRIWRDDAVNRLHVTVSSGASVLRVRDEIRRRYGEAHYLRVVTVDEMRRAVVAMLDDAYSGAYAVLVVMVAVAMLGVANFQLAALVARRSAFRLLRAVGIARAQMRRTLAFEAALIGAVGVALGLVGGALAGRVLVLGAVPALYGWRFDLVFPLDVAVGLAMLTIVLAIAAAALPGRLAARG
jgi:putative ABC transport system permease protein